MSKVSRALGPGAKAPPDLVVPDVGTESSTTEVLQAAIATAALRIVEHDAVIRAGEDAEGVHQARVGCRRLRSDLRTYGDLVEPAWSQPLREELRWLAGELGGVRDLDVLAERLHRACDRLDDDDRAEMVTVLARLDGERQRAVARAIAALDSDRYLSLLDALVDAARAPRTRPAAEGPAAAAVPPLAATAFSKLRKAVRKAGGDPTDEQLHRLRIKAKRARYAADVAEPLVGDAAHDASKAIAALQDVLGDHHDCVVAERWLSTASHTATPAQCFALGQLVADQRAEARRLRREWRSAWKTAKRTGRSAWKGS
jgi:CHAD domain-containing protein